MWCLFILVLINAAADQSGWAYPIRFNVGGIEFNVFLITLLFATFVALLRGPAYAAQFPTGRLHPAFLKLLIIYAVAWCVGVLGLILYNSDLIAMKEVGIAVRDFAVLPLSIFLGYRLTSTLKSAERYAYIMIIAGVAVSLLLLVNFGNNAEAVGSRGNINIMRTNKFVPAYAGLASLLAAYAFLVNVRLFNATLTVLIVSFCLVGQFAPLNRSDWLAYLGGLASIVLLLPVGQRGRAVFWGVALVPVLALALWVGTIAASKATGLDFAAKMQDRVMSMVPGMGSSRASKAWETRLPSITNDLTAFAKHPITGGGFGVQEKMSVETGQTMSNFHHNAWTNYLAKAGPLGLLASVATMVVLFKVSRRMVMDRFDRSTMIIGGLGFITAAYITVLGLGTGSFNSLRGAIPLGVTLGVVLRARDIQLYLQQMQFYQQGANDQFTLDEHGYIVPAHYN